MLYSEARSRIQSGDILVWEIKKIGSVIDALLYGYQKIYKTNYSHVGVAIRIGGRLFCLEARPPVVRLIPISMLDDFLWLDLNIKWKDSYYDNVFKHIGKPYSLLDYIKSVFMMPSSDDNFYCSEFAARLLKDLGVIENSDIGINPKVLVESLMEQLKLSPTSISMDKGNL